MEAEVKMRTLEVVKQKEEIEKTYENTKLLSEIGRDVTAQLSVEKIIEVVYERINKLMAATGFGLGIYNEANNSIDFPGYIENGVKLPDGGYDLVRDKDRLSCVCFNEDLEMHINDLETEYGKYTKAFLQPVRGKSCFSIIYLPIKAKNKKIGVITVQSFEKNVFTEYHLNIVRTIGIYAGIALENAGLYQNMEVRVQERTQELIKSHEDSKLLNQIGQELISTLNFNTAMDILYKYVKELMDSSVFSIRLVNTEKDELDYVYSIEHEKHIPPFSVPMNNDNNYSVVCVKRNIEILINDHAKEFNKYVKEVFVLAGGAPESMIFYPLRKGDKVLGVISLQAFAKNAYTDYHLNIVRTLAHYTVIALENSRHYEVMEEEVRVRTQEVVKQKEEIEKTYEDAKLLSEIGRHITSQLSIEQINEVVYQRINKLMHAEGFGIGIFEETNNQLVYPGYIENGEILEECYDALDNKNNLAAYCFNNDQQIVIGYLREDYIKYIPSYNPPQAGEEVTSLIYLPLMAKDKKIGVITVQSFEKNAYTEYHLNILQSIAVYTGIAIDNASLYENMEERVVERTQEIDRAYQNTKLIGQISRDIAESLSVEKIIAKVYDNINTLMDATCFGIGIYDPASEIINMPGFIENGEKMELFGYNIHDDRLATWCFNNQKEIFISDYFEEYNKYLKGTIKKAVSGKDSTSIIYLPLWLKKKLSD
ncbi:MAG: GAF domain-containing protein [Crocinitomicaceae bacterium]|nr:GAF domain-containing protein [Crocinitomicaceae bacterium]